MEDNSEESILDCLQKNFSQKSDFQERDFESQYQDNVYMEKEILQNALLDYFYEDNELIADDGNDNDMAAEEL